MTEDTQQDEQQEPAASAEDLLEKNREAVDAALKMRANAQVLERIVVPNPEIRYGKFSDVVPDLNFEVEEGQAEPDAISFRAGNRNYVFPLNAQNKAGLLNRMSGGIDVASPADIARVAKQT